MVFSRLFLPILLLLFASLASFFTLAEIQVKEIELTKRERISSTNFRYEFDVTIENTGENAQNIIADVSSSNLASDVSASRLSLDELLAEDSAVMQGKLVLIQNRRVRFNENDLNFSFSYEPVVALNPFEQTFSAHSAYIRNEHNNFFVERGIATQEQLADKISASYAQFFELLPETIYPDGDVDVTVALDDPFDVLDGRWNARGDNGTSPSVDIFVSEEELVVSPTWNSRSDAIALKFQQFAPIDFSAGGTISYEMEVDDSYVFDGNMAVQLILEDENFRPAFFAYRQLNESGKQFVSVENITATSAFGYVADGFDFTKVAGVGFQFLANGKPISVGGNLYIDNVKVSAIAPPAFAFEDNMENGIANWFVQNDNGSALPVALSTDGTALIVSPQWFSSNDAFTVKNQQIGFIDMNEGINIDVTLRLPQSYVDDGNLALQLVIEDSQFNVGFTAFTGINGRPANENFTLRFENISPDSNYGFINGGFNFSELAGVGLQILAQGKPVEVGGDIVIEQVNIVRNADIGSQAPIVPESNTSVLFAAADNMAFVKAIHSNDILSEGMSYGMMLAVMNDDKTTFDKLWKFTKTYMQNKEGPQKDFFAWRLSTKAPYEPLDENPAPDGEEYFAMALFFAHNRWGSGEGIFDYSHEANAILHDMIFTRTDTTRFMMNPEFHQIEFTTTLFAESFTDASYHLPAFYELWALWADENNDFWHEAARVSREFLVKSAHHATGLHSDYSTHEGDPKVTSFNPNSHKAAFDSFRVIGNIAMDYHWFSQNQDLADVVDRQVNFFESEINTFGNFIAVYEVDGTREPGINFRGEGRNAMNGYGATVSELPFSNEMLQSLWEQELPTGQFRYYDGFLYMFSLMHAGGEFIIHKPQ